ncbi:unnamed protein product [Soboliphyme baturini]|uniref:Transmembrane protein n=1 Tax=Soboliphyme baturini TaxID=241478 RepID=A0A183ID58_9BILA|nr:unnamed protein product [Soboliphyme baturini]
MRPMPLWNTVTMIGGTIVFVVVLVCVALLNSRSVAATATTARMTTSGKMASLSQTSIPSKLARHGRRSRHRKMKWSGLNNFSLFDRFSRWKIMRFLPKTYLIQPVFTEVNVVYTLNVPFYVRMYRDLEATYAAHSMESVNVLDRNPGEVNVGETKVEGHFSPADPPRHSAIEE